MLLIRATRIARGQSAYSIARAAGIQPPRLSLIERGRIPPNPEEREALAEALGVEASALTEPARLEVVRGTET